MTDRSVMAPLGASASRRVLLEMPDGSVQPVMNVPEGIKDDEVASKYGGRVMSTTEDVLRAGASGVPFALSETTTAIPKAILGLRRMTGMFGNEEWNQKAAQVQALEKVLKGYTGGDYAPRTKAGEYSKSIVAGATPIPGLGPLKLQMLLGAASGALGQGASDAGMGMAGSVAASSLPFLLATGANLMKSRHPVTQTKNALEALTPEQSTTMDYNLRAAREDNLPMMAWQAAPEGSEVRNLGQAVASAPQSIPIRKVMNLQAMDITGDKALRPPTQSATSRIGGPMYEAVKHQPIDPKSVQAIRNNILDILPEKQFASDSAQAAMVKSVADQFGSMREVPVGDTIVGLQQRIRALPPNDPQIKSLNTEIVQRLQGNLPPQTEFVPNVYTFGQVKNIQQNPKLPANLGNIDLDKATKLSIRRAINDVAEAINPDFAAANRKWAQLSDMERIVEQTSTRNRPTGLSAASGAKTELIPELLYAGATTPAWASMPLIRELAQRSMMKKYNNAFLASDPAALYALAAERPFTSASKLFGAGLLAPFKQGEFQLQEQDQ